MFDFLNERNKTKNRFVEFGVVKNKFRFNGTHHLCMSDGIDGCGYDTKIDCGDCKYNGQKFGRKNPNSKCNQNK